MAKLLSTIVNGFISSVNFISGLAGSGWRISMVNGKAKAEFDDLVIRNTMTVFELLISKIRSLKGALGITQGSGKVRSVRWDDTNFYLEIEDEMSFVANDIVRCMEFSGNLRSYWVIVSAVTGNEITVLKSEFAGVVPLAGDELVQFGNTTDKRRQSAIYLHADENGQPAIDVMFGIDKKSFDGCVKVRLGGDLPGTDGLKGFYSENGMIKGVDSEGHTVYCLYPDGTAELGAGSALFKPDKSGHIAGGAISWQWDATRNKYVCIMGDVVLQWDNLSQEVQENLKGEDGVSIVWKGDSPTPPVSPEKNWVYRDTDNGQVYIYTGTSWALMVADGNDGADGAKGSDGWNVYITYNDSLAEPVIPSGDGTTGGWHTNATADVVWMSQKVAASATSGTWGEPIKVKGEKGDPGQRGLDGLQGARGEQGIPGNNGTDGRTSYFHIKYSLNANGNPMTETPSTYIGTYVDFDSADSSDYTKYTWHRFEGLQGARGEQGIPGNNGTDGRTSYLHIKYSNDGGKTFTSNNGETPGDYIGQYTDFEINDSLEISRYTWSKIKGEPGRDANLLPWLKDWDSNKTQIGNDYLVSPKIFSGINAGTADNPALTGVALGRGVITVNENGVEKQKSGIFGLKDGKITFSIDAETGEAMYCGELNVNNNFTVDAGGKMTAKGASITGDFETINQANKIVISSEMNNVQLFQDGVLVGSLGFGVYSNYNLPSLELYGVGLNSTLEITPLGIVLHNTAGDSDLFSLNALGFYCRNGINVNGPARLDGGAFFISKSISEGMTLTSDNFIVLCKNTSSITVYLPSHPDSGQTIYIRRCGAGVEIHGNGAPIYRGSDGNNSRPLTNTGHAALLMWDEDRWYFNYLDI